jgi:hypothetical protein
VALDEVEKLWNEIGLSLTPKLHTLMRHVLEHMRRVGGFGEILEDHVEKSHHDMDKFHQRAARLRSPEMRAFSFSHHEKTGNTPDVIAAGKKSMEMKSASGQSLVQLVQVWGKFV